MRLDAVEKLYRDYGAMVLRRARRILGDEQAARDAMQEVFVRVLKAHSEFRGDASPVTWLYRITTNFCLTALRDEARRRQLLEKNIAPPPAGRNDDPSDRLTVRTLLAGVPEELRDVAVYHWVDQMSHSEIAEIIGVSRRTVGNRLAELERLVRGNP
jgi:RNA polymerase sigma factor (sigma-70 family)